MNRKKRPYLLRPELLSFNEFQAPDRWYLVRNTLGKDGSHTKVEYTTSTTWRDDSLLMSVTKSHLWAKIIQSVTVHMSTVVGWMYILWFADRYKHRLILPCTVSNVKYYGPLNITSCRMCTYIQCGELADCLVRGMKCFAGFRPSPTFRSFKFYRGRLCISSFGIDKECTSRGLGSLQMAISYLTISSLVSRIGRIIIIIKRTKVPGSRNVTSPY